MVSPLVVRIDTLRSLAHGGISGSYATVGGPFIFPAKLICITNDTDGDMLFSTDGTTDMLFIAASSYKLFDLNTNRLGLEQVWNLPVGTQFYVKQSTAATKNSVYIEVLG